MVKETVQCVSKTKTTDQITTQIAFNHIPKEQAPLAHSKLLVLLLDTHKLTQILISNKLVTFTENIDMIEI